MVELVGGPGTAPSMATLYYATWLDPPISLPEHGGLQMLSFLAEVWLPAP